MTVTVLQLSDTHFTAEPGGLVSGYAPESRLATVVDAWLASGQAADLVLLSGDNTDDGSADGYARLQGALLPIDAPVLALPGNHDDPALVSSVFGGATVAELGEWRIVALDSSRPQQVHGTLDVAAAVEFLDALDASESRPTVVAIHHPPVSRSTNQWFQLDGAEELLDALGQRPYVRAVVSGHLHDAFELAGPGDLALLGCPSTLMAIGHSGDQFTIGADAPTGARVLLLEDDGTMSSSVFVA